MDSIYVFVAVAAVLGLIVIAARYGRTRISFRGEESTLPESDSDASGSLLTGILDGSSSHGGSHHGAGDTGSHSGGHDSGSHGGFDGGAHH